MMRFGNNHSGLSKKRKLFFFVVIAAGIITLILAFGMNNRKPQDSVEISGIGAITAPEDRKKAISKALYNVLRASIPNNKIINIKDVVVRESSYGDNYDPLIDIHRSSFIIDIKSVRQSYVVYYEWSGNSKNPNISGYPVTIQCLPKELLIYGEFNCMAVMKSDDTSPVDIINRYLPYHVESKYKITGVATGTDNTPVLTVEAYMPGWMAKMTPELLAQYTTEIQAWVKSKGLDPNNYKINYIY